MKKYLGKLFLFIWLVSLPALGYIATIWQLNWEFENNSVGSLAYRFLHGMPVVMGVCFIAALTWLCIGMGLAVLYDKIISIRTGQSLIKQ